MTSSPDNQSAAYWRSKAEQYKERLDAETRERQRLSAMLAEVASISHEMTRDATYHGQRLARLVRP